MTDQVVLVTIEGRHTFSLQGKQTISFDVAQLQKQAIVDAIITYTKQYPKDADNFIGMALGFYEIPLKDFYPEIKDITELNDRTLAEMVRWDTKKKLLKGEQDEQETNRGPAS